MRRNLEILSKKEFDLLVIGGGIYGAAVAREAVLRGLEVALIDKADFASGTSSNSLKIIHGGLRYLQHADFKRMRESINERRIFMQIAPHLIHPIGCAMPTYGHFVKGPEVMRIALLMNDILSFDRNKLGDSQKHIPMGKILSREEMLELVPFVDRNKLTGGALWYDAYMTNSERLVLSFIKSITESGAEAANYVRAEQILVANGRVIGAKAKDALTGNEFDIRAKMTIGTVGPWINNHFSSIPGNINSRKVGLSTGLNLVVKRKFSNNIAFGVPSRYTYQDKDAIINRGSRLLFVVPWRDCSIIGTAHKPYPGNTEDFQTTEDAIQEFLDELNKALVGADIKREEVSYFYGGLLPMAQSQEQSGDVNIEKHFEIIDHEKENNLPGLISLKSVKYTTARGVAEKATKLIANKLGFGKISVKSDKVPLWGGDIKDFNDFIKSREPVTINIDNDIVTHLKTTYGSRYMDVLKLTEKDPDLLERIDSNGPIIKAEIVYGIREEMAEKLTDVVFRRTELGTIGKPAECVVDTCANLMANELGWNDERKSLEKASVEECYQTA